MEIKLDDHLCFQLYVASRLIIQGYADGLSHLKLTYPKYLALVAMSEHPELTVKELGKLLCLDSGTLSPLLRSLELAGLVERRRASHDQRVVTTHLTARGVTARHAAGKVAVDLFCKTKMTQKAFRQLKGDVGEFTALCKDII